ncbi:hypothetical protein [Hymenobacter elongatus]|uniref:Lipoprotein n=1 Tax=Hymenobacter elongatus TaxID=877208 RepID=A0A4Z0PMI1_9BACT|nr:hypothetical protein [Hymenobacter elongatus]TGE17551.1 hypothetical protein E5J99_06775 [Hymenobacter elongatus]
MYKHVFLFFPLLAAACTGPTDTTRLVLLRVANDSQEKQVPIQVLCDGKSVLDTVVAKYKTADDRLVRHLVLPVGRHRIQAVCRPLHARLDTIISTSGHNVLGLTFRYDSIEATPQKTYFADGSEGEIVFPSLYIPPGFVLYQFQSKEPLQPPTNPARNRPGEAAGREAP